LSLAGCGRYLLTLVSETPVAEQTNGYNWSGRYGNILQTLTVVGVALSAIYAGVIMPLHEQLRDLQTSIGSTAATDTQNLEKMGDFTIAQLDKKLSKDEHAEFKLRTDKSVENLQQEIASGRSDVAFLRDNQVTRAEHVTHWDQIKESIMEMRKQIDDLRKDFGGQYTVSEKLKDMQDQLNQMRDLHQAATAPAAMQKEQKP